MVRRVKSGAFWTLVLSILIAPVAACSEMADPETLSEKCEYGISLALAGELEEAEQVFLSLLSGAPADARALSNLGNLHLLRGELESALAFYDKAAQSDTADGGIHLNRATALLLLGKSAEAHDEAARGIQMVGDAVEAARLLGLTTHDSHESESKAAERTVVNKSEVRNLLAEASLGTRGDSLDGGEMEQPVRETAETEAEKTRKRLRAWRSAGVRAAERSEAASVLYWKR